MIYLLIENNKLMLFTALTSYKVHTDNHGQEFNVDWPQIFICMTFMCIIYLKVSCSEHTKWRNFYDSI